MPNFFAGKIVIVTGSSNGIGRESARQFAARGAKVTLCGRNADTIKETRRQCIESGAKESDILEVLGELNNDETPARIIKETLDKFGQIDVLVNNAGTAFVDAQMRTGIEQPVELFDKTITVNTRAVIVLSNLAIASLEKTKGSIINISSIAGSLVVTPNNPYYAMSKACLDQLTVQMAGTLINKGIRVNGISPGIVRSDFGAKLGMPPAMVEAMYTEAENNKEALPLGRYGQPEDIANLITFLADRSLSEFIVGQTIVSDGGSLIKNTLISREFKLPEQ